MRLSLTILANSVRGGDCVNTGTILVNYRNLVEDGTCSAKLSGDPKLGPLTDNGGATPTMALLATSPAIDAGGVGVTIFARIQISAVRNVHKDCTATLAPSNLYSHTR